MCLGREAVVSWSFSLDTDSNSSQPSIKELNIQHQSITSHVPCRCYLHYSFLPILPMLI